MLLALILMLALLLVPVWLRLPRPRWLWGGSAAWLLLLGASLAGAPVEPHLSSALAMTTLCGVTAHVLESLK